MSKQVKYKGFGEEKSAAGWARALGLPRVTVYQYLQQGISPEDIAMGRGVTEINLEEPPRKPREGHRQYETKKLMEYLLDDSGYDPDEVKVNVISGKYRLQIVWNDIIIGAYDSTCDVLLLTGGDRLKLRKPYVGEQRIEYVDGKWNLTGDTKMAMLRKSAKERGLGWLES